MAGSVIECEGRKMMPPLPEDFAQQIENPRAHYTECRARRTRIAAHVLGGLAWFLVCAGVCVAIFWFPFDNPKDSKWWGRLAGLVAIIGFLGLVAAGHALATSKELVVLFPTLGFVRIKRQQVEAYRWDEVLDVTLDWSFGKLAALTERSETAQLTSVWFEFPAAPTFFLSSGSITIRCKDGRSIKLDYLLENFEEIARVIQRQTFSRLWPQALADLTAGRSVVCGSLTLSREGLHSPKGFLPWNQFKEILVEVGDFKVKRRGHLWAWHQETLSKLPNVHVFVGLATYAHWVGTSEA
jgi:hypothetical protein